MSLGRPLVTVIIPAYNAGHKLHEALQSIRLQRLTDLEAVVVDDGSHDNTGAIAQSFVDEDPRFRLVRQPNAGVGAARNTGIRLARGRYIAPLDADDHWAPEKLEQQVDVMERSDERSGLVYCWSNRIDDQGRTVAFSHPYTVEGRTHRAMLLRNFLGNASVPLFRATALHRVGLYLTRHEQAGNQGCEDWDLALRVAEEFDVRVVPRYLVNYRETSSSMSLQAASMMASYKLLINRVRQRDRDMPAAIFRWSAGHFYFYLASKTYRAARYSGCLRAAGAAVRADPVLLFNRRLYHLLAGSVIHGATGNRFRTGRSSVAAGLAAPPPTAGSSGFVERVQLHRWIAVCN